MQGGGGPAEPVLSKQSVLADDVKSNAKDGVPAPVRASETGRARNWTMPPLRLEREWREHSAEQNDLLSFCERRNSATIDNRCVEFDRRENQRCAFTMAEILLSLTIIGVVAAITLPSLTGNINERTWNTQRKALYARMSQAISLMPSLNGFGTLEGTIGSSGSQSITEDNVAETFVTAGLSKALKINNICDNEHLADCGIPEKVTPLSGTAISFPAKMSELNENNISFTHLAAAGSSYSTIQFDKLDTKAAAFETANGESVAVFYNPVCTSSMDESNMIFMQNKMCANFVYDLNGTKGPNTYGKDVGVITVFYPTDSLVVSPQPYPQDAASGTSASISVSGVCKNLDSEYRLPTKEDLASLVINKNIVGNLSAPRYVSSSFTSNASNMWYLHVPTIGCYHMEWGDVDVSIRCVKR